MEAQAKYKQFAVARACGMVAGVSLALLVGAISVTALSNLVRDEGGGLGYLAIFIGGPLFLTALGIWIYLVLKGAAGHGLEKIMWIPVAASMAILPVAVVLESVDDAIYGSSHPAVQEIHVNLTGQTIFLQTESSYGYEVLEGNDPDRFTKVDRDPAMNNRADKMRAYVGALPAPGFTSMSVTYGRADAPASVVPVRVMPAPALWTAHSLDLASADAEELTHYYYHYPNRVEVVTAIDGGDGYAKRFKRGAPVVQVVIHNLGSEEIVRLEVNGQPLSMPWSIEPAAQRCHPGSHEAIDQPQAPLTLRWQTAATDAQWRQATVAVPAFKNREPTQGSIEEDTVHLYIKPDGSLAAQREQTLDVDLFTSGNRVTAAVPPFETDPTCGLVTGSHND